MGSSASVSSYVSNFDFQTAHGPGYENYTDGKCENATSTVLQKCKEAKLHWIFNSPSNSKQVKFHTDFKELESKFVRNILRTEHELANFSMNLTPSPEMPIKIEKTIVPAPAPAKKREIVDQNEENRSFVLLPSRSARYFKNLILLDDPDAKYYDNPSIDQKGGADLNVNPKSYVLPPDKLSKLKVLSK